MTTDAVCKDYQTDKCPLNIDDRVDGLEERVEKWQDDYQKFKVDIAASQARTQTYVEESAKREKERIEAEAEKAKAEAEEKKQLLDMICQNSKINNALLTKVIVALIAIALAMAGLKALAPGIF
jgi:hypothetical protein